MVSISSRSTISLGAPGCSWEPPLALGTLQAWDASERPEGDVARPEGSPPSIHPALCLKPSGDRESMQSSSWLTNSCTLSAVPRPPPACQPPHLPNGAQEARSGLASAVPPKDTFSHQAQCCLCTLHPAVLCQRGTGQRLFCTSCSPPPSRYLCLWLLVPTGCGALSLVPWPRLSSLL